MKGRLVNLVPATLAVPSQAIDHIVRPALLDDETNRVGETNRVMGSVAGEEEHVALTDDDVAECAIVDDLKHHGTLVLVEPLRSLVNMVVGPGVGTADDHDGEVFIVDAVIVDGRLQQMRVLL